jgi:hypothetical protein
MFIVAVKRFQMEIFACEEMSSRNLTIEMLNSSTRIKVDTSTLPWRTMTPVQHDEVIPGPRQRAAVVVAHPDDETLWCGGYILTHPEFHWRIVTLCRASDPDRAPKFRRVLEQLGAEGEMADLDDEPDQVPLPIEQIQETIARLLAGNQLQPDSHPWPEGRVHTSPPP